MSGVRQPPYVRHMVHARRTAEAADLVSPLSGYTHAESYRLRLSGERGVRCVESEAGAGAGVIRYVATAAAVAG